MLAELGQIEKTRGELYKAKAYSTAVQSLKRYPKRVDSGAEAASTFFLEKHPKIFCFFGCRA
jgi:DNA polymerase/3'-5' exonuclease PolX